VDVNDSITLPHSVGWDRSHPIRSVAETLAAPIGVFDSGLGGLTVVREIRKHLPNERVIYFGDLARLPYGIKSDAQIRDFSRQNTDFLLRFHIKALVIACNSSASAATLYLKERYTLPIIDVIQPAVGEATKKTKSGRIGIIGTQATIASGAYEQFIKRMDPKIQVFQTACPLLVPLVEEGILEGSLAKMVLARYIKPLLKKKIDTLVLGCTHYPLLRREIAKMVGRSVRLIDSAPACARRLERLLVPNDKAKQGARTGGLDVFVSDFSERFLRVGKRFLGETLSDLQVVRLQSEISEGGKWML